MTQLTNEFTLKIRAAAEAVYPDPEELDAFMGNWHVGLATHVTGAGDRVMPDIIRTAEQAAQLIDYLNRQAADKGGMSAPAA